MTSSEFGPYGNAAGPGEVEYLDAPTLPSDQAPVVHTPTLVERLLGGDWRPALRVILPTLLVAGALAAVTAASQLLTSSPISRFLLVELAPRTTSSYFHGIAREIAAAFGSPVGLGGLFGDGNYRIPPLGISVAAVGVFALLLRRAVADPDLPQRLITAVRCAASVVVVLVVVSLFGTVHARTFGTPITTTVAPGKVALWASLAFGVVALVVALRPLDLLERAVPRIRRDEWYPAWVGAVVAVATAVVLGFAAAVGAGFAESGSKGDTARMLPRAVGHTVDLGTYGWNASLLGPLRGDGRLVTFDDVSLLHRHGGSAWYFLLLLLPVLSVAAGAFAIRRYAGTVDTRALSRCCYRMALPVTVLFAVFAAASTAHTANRTFVGTSTGTSTGVTRATTTTASTGPEVLLGSLRVALVYLVLGFLAGQVVLRTAHLRRRVAAPAAAPAHPGYAPPAAPPAPWTPGIEFVPEHPYGPAPGSGVPVAEGPRRRRRPRATAVITVVAAIVLVAAAGVAVERHGGRDAHGGVDAGRIQIGSGPDDNQGTDNDTVTLDPGTGEVVSPSDDPGFTYGGSGSSTQEDIEARVTLQELSVAEETYQSANGTYTDDDGELDGYTEPDDVDVEIYYADDSSYCAEASGYDSQNQYTYDSETGTVEVGDNC